VPDQRGSGESGDPADPATLRVDRLVEDVEALRVHLGLERMDLLAHSAGAVLATMYAAAYPQRLSRLLLVAPGLITVDHDEDDAALDAALARRSGEPWYAAARRAADAIILGDLSMENLVASRPFYYADRTSAAVRRRARPVRHRGRGPRGGSGVRRCRRRCPAAGRALPVDRRPRGLLRRPRGLPRLMPRLAASWLPAVNADRPHASTQRDPPQPTG
jgi:pimeloyl-ACP methyl ester carboxylesterase